MWIEKWIPCQSTNDIIVKFSSFCTVAQNEKDLFIMRLRSDYGGEFENTNFESFCKTHRFKWTWCISYFWTKVVNTACYVLNKILIRCILNRTPYEIWKNKKPKISYFKIFDNKCFVFRTMWTQDKFARKFDEGMFFGYLERSKSYRVFIKSTQTMIKSFHIKFDEYPKNSQYSTSYLKAINDEQPQPSYHK